MQDYQEHNQQTDIGMFLSPVANIKMQIFVYLKRMWSLQEHLDLNITCLNRNRFVSFPYKTFMFFPTYGTQELFVGTVRQKLMRYKFKQTFFIHGKEMRVSIQFLKRFEIQGADTLLCSIYSSFNCTNVCTVKHTVRG